MAAPALSVVIPVYNEEAVLPALFARLYPALDADLQNPPEEIAKLLAKMDEGHDYVGSIRRMRQDAAWRRWASKAMNRMRERITHIKMTDQGCMLRAYDRPIIDAIRASREVSTYIPALAYSFSQNPAEVEVEHEERHAGESKYSLYKLIRLNFDIVTGFSVMPLQLFSLFGIFISLVSLGTYVVVIIQRIVSGTADGLWVIWDRDILQFFLTGMVLFGLGLIGEYVGRIYQQVRERPRFLIQAILEKPVTEAIPGGEGKNGL